MSYFRQHLSYHFSAQAGDTYMSRQEGIDNTLAIAERHAPFVILPIERGIRWIGPY